MNIKELNETLAKILELKFIPWHFESTGFADSTDEELVMAKNNASLEIVYFPITKTYGYSLLPTDDSGNLLEDEVSEHTDFNSVESLISAMHKDKQIKKYLGDVELPSVYKIHSLKHAYRDKNEGV